MSKLTCRDMDATVVFLDLEELWMGSTGDTILAFGCGYVHFCFIDVVIGYIMSLVNLMEGVVDVLKIVVKLMKVRSLPMGSAAQCEDPKPAEE